MAGSASAVMWTDWMTYLREHGCTSHTYALSIRGRGGSWQPAFSGLGGYGEDVRAAMEMIKDRDKERRDAIVVGHSSGGGLVQYCIDRRIITASGLGLAAAVSHLGSYVLALSAAQLVLTAA